MAYETDLAYIHDQGFGHIARGAAAELRTRLTEAGRHGGLVLDLGCGSGILTQQLVQDGYRGWGLDLSPAMIELARRHVPKAEFQVGSVYEVDLPPCVAVAAIGEVVNYLFDHRNSDVVFRRMLRRVHEALQPGGLFLFDAAGPDRIPPGPYRKFFEQPDWTVLVEASMDEAKTLLTRRNVTFRRHEDELYKRVEEVHELRLMGREETAAALQESGFEVEVLSSYGDVELPHGLIGYLARRTLD